MHMFPLLLVALTIVPHFTFSQESSSEEAATQQESSVNTKEDNIETTEPKTESDTEANSEEQTLDNSSTKEKTDNIIPEKPEEANSENEESESSQDSQKTAPKENSSDLPVEPQPVQEEKIVIPEQQEEKPVGIDTVSLENPQGNWLFKRIWWERAEERYEKIRLLVDSIWNSRTDFFVKRNNLSRNVLEPFYITAGLDKAELQEILSNHTQVLEKERNQDKTISDEERVLYEKIAAEEETLKQLERDVETVINLDHYIDNALQTLMEQINRVRDFETQAWKNFKEVAHTLNDAKARELYYMVEGAARNIKNISIYLERDFTQYYNRLINDVGRIIIQIQSQIEALKEKGIYLTRQSEETQQEENQQSANEEDDEDTDIKTKPKLGWFEWVVSGAKNILYSIFSVIRMPYDLIFGK